MPAAACPPATVSNRVPRGTGAASTLGWLLVVTLAGAAGCASQAKPGPLFRHDATGPATAWNHADFDAAADKFTFAVFSDLTGGERERIFDVAIAQINLLRPELILSVGDLIEGNSADADLKYAARVVRWPGR